MFRRAANLLHSVADAIDDMLASDFEFEVDELSALEEIISTDAASAGGAVRRDELAHVPSVAGAGGETAGPCAGEARRRRPPAESHIGAGRRAGAVPRPVEICLTPVDSRRRSDPGAAGGR